MQGQSEYNRLRSIAKDVLTEEEFAIYNNIAEENIYKLENGRKLRVDFFIVPYKTRYKGKYAKFKVIDRWLIGSSGSAHWTSRIKKRFVLIKESEDIGENIYINGKLFEVYKY